MVTWFYSVGVLSVYKAMFRENLLLATLLSKDRPRLYAFVHAVCSYFFLTGRTIVFHQSMAVLRPISSIKKGGKMPSFFCSRRSQCRCSQICQCASFFCVKHFEKTEYASKIIV